MDLRAKKGFIINVLFIGLWIILGILLGKIVFQYLLPFVIAWIVAFLMQKPAEIISSKIGIKKGNVAAFLSALAYIVTAALISFIIVKIFGFADSVLTQFERFSDSIMFFFDEVETVIYRIFEIFYPTGDNTANKITEKIFTEFLEKASVFLSDTVTNIIKTAPSFLFSSIVALAATCYIAKDFEGLKGFLKGLCSKKTIMNIVKIKDILKNCILKMLVGYLILMAVTFFEVTIGLMLLRIKRAVLIGFLVALIDILPVLGVGAVLIPWGVFNIITGNTFLGIGLFGLYIFITIIRNFAEPKIVGKNMGINPLFILFTMFFGFKVLGVAGLLIFPVTFIVVIKYYKSEME